ncbi:hypothetical protein YB2330_000395 [Saitoella coloradoensis]
MTTFLRPRAIAIGGILRRGYRDANPFDQVASRPLLFFSTSRTLLKNTTEKFPPVQPPKDKSPLEPTQPDKKQPRNAIMDHAPPPAPGPDFKVAIIGAGGINFGSAEGPWNHSFRLEHKLGPRLKVTALIDPHKPTSDKVLALKRQSFVEKAYAATKQYASLNEYFAELKPEDHPHAVIIGSPPQFHGSDREGIDVEIQLAKEIPGVALFVEKPVSMSPVPEAFAVGEYLDKENVINSVGYMMRYLRCVRKMKEIIKENNLTVTGTVARYVSSYAKISKPFWWTKSMSGGPVVEQGTHFCDLSRFFGGDVVLDTVQATAVEWNDPAGKLSAIPFDESTIPEHERIPRMTAATWKYENGAIGSFTHGLVLQGYKYDTTLEVYADGWQLRLVDPYDVPMLYVRSPKDDREEQHHFTDDDPYFGEIGAFIDAIEGKGPKDAILSSFTDAAKSYELSWAIRLAAERTSALRHGKSA